MAILFNGDCYFRTVPVGPASGADKTIFCRLNISSTSGVQSIYNATNTKDVAYQLGIRNGYLGVWKYGGSWVCSYIPIINQWIDFCYTYQNQGKVGNIYQNGILMATSNVQEDGGAVTETQLGGNQWNEPPSNILVEDLRVYDRILSQNEIITHGNAKGRSSNINGLIYWWPMNEGLNREMTATDIVEQKNNLVNTSLLGVAPFPRSTYTLSLTRPAGLF